MFPAIAQGTEDKGTWFRVGGFARPILLEAEVAKDLKLDFAIESGQPYMVDIRFEATSGCVVNVAPVGKRERQAVQANMANAQAQHLIAVGIERGYTLVQFTPYSQHGYALLVLGRPGRMSTIEVYPTSDVIRLLNDYLPQEEAVAA